MSTARENYRVRAHFMHAAGVIWTRYKEERQRAGGEIEKNMREGGGVEGC